MPVHSAGLLLHRVASAGREVLIGHMGGPFWRGKHEGAWSIPKGEYDPGAESPLDAARREFAEELGVPAPSGAPHPLGEFRQPSGKRLTVFALEGDVDPATFAFGEFELEWPPRSGRTVRFPELDAARWCPIAEAHPLVVRGQRPVLDAVSQALP